MSDPVVNTMSEVRFSTYLRAAGHDQARAKDLYLWNARLGAAFHIAIQAVEVSLRNRINHALMAEFGQEWWGAPSFLRELPPHMVRDLETVGHQMVASLSFGFWVGMLHKRFNPRIWTRQTRNCFPELPGSVGRDELHRNAELIARLRNRISHHEPLLHADGLKHYGLISQYLGWICSHTKAWAMVHCEVPRVVRQKP
jgi:hypothetical protein